MAGAARTSVGGASSGGGVPFYYRVEKDDSKNIIGLPMIQYRKPTAADAKASNWADGAGAPLQPTSTANDPPKKATGPPKKPVATAAASSAAPAPSPSPPPEPEKPFEKETAVEVFDATPEVAKDGTVVQSVDDSGASPSRSGSHQPTAAKGASAASTSATAAAPKSAEKPGLASRVSYMDRVAMRPPDELLAADVAATSAGVKDRSDKTGRPAKSGVSVASEYGGACRVSTRGPCAKAALTPYGGSACVLSP